MLCGTHPGIRISADTLYKKSLCLSFLKVIVRVSLFPAPFAVFAAITCPPYLICLIFFIFLGATLPNPCGFVLPVTQNTANCQPEFAFAPENGFSLLTLTLCLPFPFPPIQIYFLTITKKDTSLKFLLEKCP